MSVADGPKPPILSVPRHICRDFERASRLEWLDTNHTGAFAMGTVAGVNTRRYHGLLIASLNPPADRYSILPRVEERVTAGGLSFELATVQYPGTIHPRGLELLQEFSLGPFPSWRYQAGEVEIRKTVCLLDRQQSVLILYEATHPCRLDVRLTLSFRDYHSLTHRNSALCSHVAEDPRSISFTPYPDLPPLTILHNGRFHSEGTWLLNNEYLRELERGLDFREDLFSPGSLVFELGAGSFAWMLAALHAGGLPAPPRTPDIPAILAAETGRREFPGADPVRSMARRALDQFRVVRDDGRPTLIAGYPWFTDWTRDTLISLPALSRAGFPQRESAQILEMLADTRSQGLLPNRFADKHSQPEYNAVDATLWFFIAAHDLLAKTGDLSFLRATIYPAARDIVTWYRRGTLYDIHVDSVDNLLSAGTPQTQLTWMDARIGDSPVTPRNGKPVEINALWYNALVILALWSGLMGLEQEREALLREAEEMLASFQSSFWNPDRGCLYDLVTPSFRDPRVTPNQLFALSLPFPLLDRERARSVVDIVRHELLTSVGLRTLERNAANYRPRFEGCMADRDSAYHQGTVWPWLIGPFIAAYRYAYGESAQSSARASQFLRPLEEEFSTCCLGSLAEVFDADPPHRPGGCPSQLWSVAQFLIAWESLRSSVESP